MTVHTPIRADDVRRSYAKWAHHYDFTFALFGRNYIRQIVTKVNTEIDWGTKDRFIINVGTGTGLALPLFRSDLQITGIDLSADMLARARQRVAKRKLTNITGLYEMDATALSFIDNHFDAVTATFVMSVVPHPQKVLAEMARVTRPGGLIYLFNHFRADASEKKFLSLMERKIAPASRKVGFHSDFCRSQLKLPSCRLRLIEERDYGPLDMFTLMTLQKATD